MIKRKSHIKKSSLFTILIFLYFISLGQISEAPVNGDGSSGDPYQIATWQNLCWLSNKSTEQDASGNRYLSRNYIQTANIVFPQEGENDIHNWNNGEGFEMIGTFLHDFTGSYDGQGYTIDGLYINKNENDAGLFKKVSAGGTVKNLGVINVEFFNESGMRVGALAGHCYGGKISKCYSSGRVEGGSDAGGLIGCIETAGSLVEFCYSKTEETFGGDNVGGLIGTVHEGMVRNCYSMGVVVSNGEDCGAFVGAVHATGSTILNCFSTSKVFEYSYEKKLNILVNNGFVGSGLQYLTYENNFIDKDVSLQTKESGASPTSSIYMRNESLFTDAGWDLTTVWKMSSIKVDGYPHLQYENLPGQNDSAPWKEGIYYLVSSVEQLCWIMEDYRRWDLDYMLFNNIDASETANWADGKGAIPIGTTEVPFTGTFTSEVEGYNITGLTINRPDFDLVGMFGYISGSSTLVEKFGLTDAYIEGNENVGALVGKVYDNATIDSCSAKGEVKGNGQYVGGLVGYNYIGTIKNSYSEANVTGEDSFNGGFVGALNNGTIYNCYGSGSVSGVTYTGGFAGIVSGGEGSILKSFSTGAVSGESYVGGFAGYINTFVEDCYSMGSVTRSSGTDTNLGGFCGYLNNDISKCYSTGYVSVGTRTDRGFCGGNSGLTGIADNYFDTETSGQISSFGATAKTSAEMKDVATYENWDFPAVWHIDMHTTDPENNGYPSLKWQGFLHSTTADVNTLNATDFSYTDITIEGEITNLGYNNPTQHGMCWNITGTPTINDNKTDEGAVSTSGIFSSTINGLVQNTSYHIRAYATNSIGTAYGTEKIVTTATYLEGEGTIASPYLIKSIDDLEFLSQYPSHWSKHFEQTGDIDATGTSTWNEGAGFSPIGNGTNSFSGSYNGKGFTIDGLYINRPSSYYQGLFGLVSTGNIDNVKITNATVHGEKYVGSLLGKNNDATINNCSATGEVNASTEGVGGLNGWNSGTIQNCSAHSQSTGAGYVGGLSGYNKGTINDCYARGNNNASGQYCGGLIGRNHGGAVNRCYSTGIVNGTIDTGGLIGENFEGTIVDCFWDTQSSGMSVSSGGTGKTTNEMKTIGTFVNSGWNFSLAGNVWGANNVSNDNYPWLRFEGYEPANIWLGSSSSSWETADNWSEGEVPVNTVIIAESNNNSSINQTTTIESLIIETNAGLVLQPSVVLTVTSEIENHAGPDGLILQSDETNTAQLINGSSGVTASVKQFLVGGNWHYMGFPYAESQELVPMLKGLYVSTCDESMATNNSSDGWSYLSSSDILNSGKGYGIYHELDTTISTSGTLNANQHSIPVSYSGENKGWNLISNPFPCAVDWDYVCNNSGLSNVNNAIYVYDPSSESYASYVNGVVGGAETQDQYIAPMQGFFVRSSAAGSVILSENCKSTGSSNFKSCTNNPVIRISIKDPDNRSDQAVVYENPESTQHFNEKYDAYKILASNSLTPQIFTDYNGIIYSVNSIPEINEETEISLKMMIKQNGLHSVNIKKSENISFVYPVFLKSETGEILAQLDAENYSFNAEAGETLKMKLSFANSTGVGTNKIRSNSILRVLDRKLVLNELGGLPAKVAVYNLSGQILFSKEVQTDYLEIPIARSGVYLVRVYTSKGVVFNDRTIVNF